MKKSDAEPFTYSPKIFSNFSDAIIDVLTSNSLLSSDSIDDLPLKEFHNYTSSPDNLNLYQHKLGVENYIGNKLIYLSAGSTGTTYVTGDVVTPANPYANILSRYNPTVNFIPDNTQLYTVKQIGRFFIPSKLGILTYASFNPKVSIRTSSLSANTLYILPDLDLYGSGRGNTQHGNNLPVDHVEDVTWVTADLANDYLHGAIIKSNNMPKFYGYSSKTEINKYPQVGISKFTDNHDFWAGSEVGDIWNDPEVYKLDVPNVYKLDDRQRMLLVRKLGAYILYKHKTDIYGNQYALFKKGYSLPANAFKDISGGKTDSTGIVKYYGTTSLDGGRFPSTGSDGDGNTGDEPGCIGLDCDSDDDSSDDGGLNNPWVGDKPTEDDERRPDAPLPGDSALATCEMTCNILWGGNSLLSGVDIDGNGTNDQIFDTYGGNLSGVADGGWRPLRTGWASDALSGTPYDLTGSCAEFDNITASDFFPDIETYWEPLSSGYEGGTDITTDGDYQDQRENQFEIVPAGTLYGFVDHEAWVAGLGGLFPAKRVNMEVDPLENRFKDAGLSYWQTPYREFIPDYEHWEINVRWFNDLAGVPRTCSESLCSWDDPVMITTRGLSGLAAGGADSQQLLDPICSPYSFATGLHYSSKCGLDAETAEELWPEKYNIWSGIISYQLGLDVVNLIDDNIENKQYLVNKGLLNKYNSNAVWDFSELLGDDIVVVPTLSADCVKIVGGPGDGDQFVWWEEENEDRGMDPNYNIDAESYSGDSGMDGPDPLILQYKYWAHPAVSQTIVPIAQAGADNYHDKVVYNIERGLPQLPINNYNLFDDPTGRRRQDIHATFIPSDPGDLDDLDHDDNLWSFSDYMDHPLYSTVAADARLSTYIDKDFQRSRGYMPPPVGWWRRGALCTHHEYADASPPGVDCDYEYDKEPPIAENMLADPLSGFLVHDVWEGGYLNLEIECEKTGTDDEDVEEGTESGTPDGIDDPELPDDPEVDPEIEGCLKYMTVAGIPLLVPGAGNGTYIRQVDLYNDKVWYKQTCGGNDGDGVIVWNSTQWQLSASLGGAFLAHDEDSAAVDCPDLGTNWIDEAWSQPVIVTGVPVAGSASFTVSGYGDPGNGIYDRQQGLILDKVWYKHEDYDIDDSKKFIFKWDNTTILAGRWEMYSDTTLVAYDLSAQDAFSSEIACGWQKIDGTPFYLIGDGGDPGTGIKIKDIIDYGWCEASKYKSFTPDPGKEVDAGLYREYSPAAPNRRLLPPLWQQKYTSQGEPWFRNQSGSIIQPFSVAFKSVFTKYNLIDDSLISTTGSSIQWDQIIDIDVIYDILIIQTTTAYIFEKIEFDYETGKLLPNDTPPTYLTCENIDKEKFIQHFYNEHDNTIVVGKIVPQPVEMSSVSVSELETGYTISEAVSSTLDLTELVASWYSSSWWIDGFNTTWGIADLEDPKMVSSPSSLFGWVYVSPIGTTPDEGLWFYVYPPSDTGTNTGGPWFFTARNNSEGETILPWIWNGAAGTWAGSIGWCYVSEVEGSIRIWNTVDKKWIQWVITLDQWNNPLVIAAADPEVGTPINTFLPLVYHPELYKLDMQSFILSKIFPSKSSDIAEFKLPSDLVGNTLTYIDYPTLTYNEDSARYNVTYLGKLSGGTFDDSLAIFSSNFLVTDNNLTLLNSNIYHPEDKTPAVVIPDTVEKYKWNIEPSSMTIPVSTNKFKFTVNAIPGQLAAVGSGSGFTAVNRLIYDWGDGTELIYVNREMARIPGLVSDFGDTDGSSWKGDYTSPTKFTQTHTYHLSGSSTSTLTATVSAIYSNFHVTEYKLVINIFPYTITSSMSNVHILNTKLFNSIGDSGGVVEKLLINLEWEWPRYTTYMLLDTSISTDQLN